MQGIVSLWAGCYYEAQEVTGEAGSNVIPILVTGGAGYIGSHTAKRLAQSGFLPVVFDNLSTGHRWAVQWGPLIEGNLADVVLLRETIEKYRIQAVIHFAAHAYVGESIWNPQKYFRNNVVNSLNLLDALVESGVRRVVFSSTCATYGVPDRTPIAETHVQRPVSPYGESKYFIEHALQWYGLAYGLMSIALRYFNAAGADPEAELGEDHNPEPHLIPRVIGAALGERPRVEIYGSDYPTPDGTAVRDYVHVADLAVAHVLALTYLLDGGKSAAVNLGVGRGYSVREVIAAVERVTNRRIPVHMTARREGDPPALVADATKAAGMLQWHPQYSSLESIVETAVRWRSRPALTALKG